MGVSSSNCAHGRHNTVSVARAAPRVGGTAVATTIARSPLLVLLLPGSSRASIGLSRVHLRRRIKHSCGVNTFSKLSGGATIIRNHQWIIPSITNINNMEDTTSIKSGSTTATNGTKRKRSSEPKFYAVRSGHKPGVYYTWADCLEQVKGFKKAMCE